MAGGKHLIAGMWGTSNLTLYLMTAGPDISDDPVIVDRIQGPGAAQVDQKEYATLLKSLTEGWIKRAERGDLALIPHIFLAGMVGSTIGWIDAGYGDCPADGASIRLSKAGDVADYPVHIASGMKCRKLNGEPDIMRGEETEVLGLFTLLPALKKGRHLALIPGTHSKWILLEEGRLTRFYTTVSGELFAAISAATVLVGGDTITAQEISAGFKKGVATAFSEETPFLEALFSLRARQVVGGDTASDASERLSGLIVGADILTAKDVLREADGPVIVIGNDLLAKRYQWALEHYGATVQLLSSDKAAAAGLWSLAHQKG